jgi:alpha-N-arabinofuranosidase
MIRPLKELKPGYGPHNLYAEHYNFPIRKYIRHDPDNMTMMGMPPMGRHGDMPGALGNASVLLAFLRHADRVKVGCMTGGLGTLASTDREHVWRNAGYYPFTQLMTYGRGVSMQTRVDCDTFDIPGYAIDDNSQYYRHEGLPFIDTAAALDEDKGELNVFVINRNWEASNDVDIDVRGFEGYKFIEHIQMYTEDLMAANTYENPNAIVPTVNKDAKFENGRVSANLKSLSWNIFRFSK